MSMPFHIEALSSGMKAKLDVKYRRNEGPYLDINNFQRSSYLNNRDTVLPFTTKTKAYGTYVRRKNS